MRFDQFSSANVKVYTYLLTKNLPSFFIVDTEKVFEPMGIEERIRKIINRTPLNNSEKNDYWKVSFEEGIHPSDVDEDKLPKAKKIVEDNSFPNFRLVHTQWRYDYAFVTPSGISYANIAC